MSPFHEAWDSIQYELRIVRLLAWSRVQGRKIKSKLLFNDYLQAPTALLLQFTVRVRRSRISSRKGEADLEVNGASSRAVAMQLMKIYLSALSQNEEQKLDNKNITLNF